MADSLMGAGNRQDEPGGLTVLEKKEHHKTAKQNTTVMGPVHGT